MTDKEFPDSDWKLLKEVNRAAYDRHCSASIDEISALLQDSTLRPGEKFDNLSNFTRKRSKELYSIFNAFNFSHSNAMLILISLNNWGLVTKDELNRFSPTTQARVQRSAEGFR